MKQRKPLVIGLLAGTLLLASGCSGNKAPASSEPSKATAAEPTQASKSTTVTDTKPYLEIVNERTVVAIVSAIDHETRKVTLAGEEGETVEFTVSEEVRNLDQVSAGDRVSIQVVEDLVVEVMDGEGVSASEAVVAGAERAEEGDMPGMVASATQASVYKVEAIDLEAGTYTLSDANGNQQTFTARNPRYLEQSEVGDVVLVSLTSMVVAQVEKLPAE